MLGNICAAGSADELFALVNMRDEYMKRYVASYAMRNIQVQPNKFKIVTISDTDPSSRNDTIIGSILLPSSRAMFLLMEGNYQGFVYEYYSKLDSSPEIQEYLLVLITGLVERGFDYIFFFDNNDYNMWYPIYKALSDYFASRYGIICHENTLHYPNNFLIPSVPITSVLSLQQLIRHHGLSQNNGQLFVQC